MKILTSFTFFLCFLSLIVLVEIPSFNCYVQAKSDESTKHITPKTLENIPENLIEVSKITVEDTTEDYLINIDERLAKNKIEALAAAMKVKETLKDYAIGHQNIEEKAIYYHGNNLKE